MRNDRQTPDTNASNFYFSGQPKRENRPQQLNGNARWDNRLTYYLLYFIVFACKTQDVL